jgi:hypothetical protein
MNALSTRLCRGLTGLFLVGIFIPAWAEVRFCEDLSNYTDQSDFEAKSKPDHPFSINIWRLEGANPQFKNDAAVNDQATMKLDGKLFRANSANYLIPPASAAIFAAIYQTGGWNISSNPTDWFMVRYFDSGAASSPLEFNLYYSEGDTAKGLGLVWIPWSGLKVISTVNEKTDFIGKLERTPGWHTIEWYIEKGEKGICKLFLDGKEIYVGNGLFRHGVSGFRMGSRWANKENGSASAFAFDSIVQSDKRIEIVPENKKQE